jgi:hypothetical protein
MLERTQGGAETLAYLGVKPLALGGRG